MKTDADPKSAGHRHYRWGTLLIWLGVLIWVPFILLKLDGENPSFLWYLPFHLLGVVGGSRLRSFARKELELPRRKRNLLQMAGSILIALGILSWAPYFYMKMFTQTPVDVMDFLPFHLTGVLGGILLLGINHLTARKNG